MTRRLPATAVIALTVLLLGACGDSPARSDGAWGGSIDTLASGRVVVHNPDVPLWAAGEEWQLRERFRVGRVEGEGPDLFGEIRDVEFGPDGQLYVLEAQASEIRVFGEDGTHLLTFARQGEGPGELSRPIGMAFDPQGVLWVNNWGNGRYSAFDASTGEVLREPRRLAGFGMIPWPGGIDRSGRMVDVGLGADGEPAILGLDSTYAPTDTLPMPREDDRYRVFFRRGNQVMMSMQDPFTPAPTWALHPDGGIVLGEGSAYRLHRIAFDGDTVLTIEVERDRIPVTSAERDSALARFEDMRELAGDAVPDRRPNVPDEKPAHGRLFVDDAGNTWVVRARAAGDPAAWDVIGPDGRLLGTVTSPLPVGYMQPSVRGDRMAVATMVEDIPTVIVYEIAR